MPPSTPTQAEALAAAQATQTALTAVANSVFIADATVIIEDLINNQGRFRVYLNPIEHLSMKDIQTYFQGLGYTVGIPYRCGFWGSNNVPYFWGQTYYSWLAERGICGCGACKIVISWGPFPPSPFCY